MAGRWTRVVAIAAALTLLSGMLATVAATDRPAVSSPSVKDAPKGRGKVVQSERGKVKLRSVKPGKSRPQGEEPNLRSPLAERSTDAASEGRAPRAPGLTPTLATYVARPAVAKPGFSGQAQDGLVPSDSYVAVGPEHIVQVVNSRIRVTDRAGNELENLTLDAFIGAFLVGAQPPLDPDAWYDPWVLFDAVRGRWLIVATGYECGTGLGSDFGDGYIFTATSDTTDPTGTWLGGLLIGADWLYDFSAPGTSTDKFAIGTNTYQMTSASCASVSSSDYLGTDIYVYDWTDWLIEGQIPTVYDVQTNATADDAYFTPRIASQAPATSSRLHVIIEHFSNDFNTLPGTNHVVYQSFTGSVASGTFGQESEHDLTEASQAGPFEVPPAPAQPGPDTIVDAVDERPTDAVWQSSQLDFVSTYPCTPSGDSADRACVRITELNTLGVGAATPPTVTQDFLIASNGQHNFMGGIGLAGNGTLHAVWTRSSGSLAPSSYAAHQLPSDAADSVSSPELLISGSGAYTGSERWGDYVGVAQDPYVANQVWQANQRSAGGSWATHISRLQPQGTTYVPITPVRVLDTRNGTGGLSGTFKNLVPRTWAIAGDPDFPTIPAAAVAVTGNVTVLGQTKGGYVYIGPVPTSKPPASTINFPTGENFTNNIVVSLSATGSLSATYASSSGATTNLVVDVTGYFLADDTGATFEPLAPVRVLDTRFGTGGLATFAHGVPQTLKVTEANGIPAGAAAIAANLTAIGQTTAGRLSVTTAPDPAPTTNTLNFSASGTRSNGIFAPLDGDGELSITFNSSSTTTATSEVILDVTGYFVAGTSGLRFVPLNPARLMDTRPIGVLSALSGPFSMGTARTFDVTGHWGVPAGAAAISANLTVIEQSRSGNVSVTTTPDDEPDTSTISFPSSGTRSNGFVVALDVDGDAAATFRSTGAGTVNLIIDMSGYFE